jgi:hypothetical protein
VHELRSFLVLLVVTAGSAYGAVHAPLLVFDSNGTFVGPLVDTNQVLLEIGGEPHRVVVRSTGIAVTNDIFFVHSVADCSDGRTRDTFTSSQLPPVAPAFAGQLIYAVGAPTAISACNPAPQCGSPACAPGTTALYVEQLGSSDELGDAGVCAPMCLNSVIELIPVASVPAPALVPPLRVESNPGRLFVPVTPCRVVDTRLAGGQLPGGTYSQRIQGTCGVPDGASAVAINLTVVAAGNVGHAAIHAAGAPPASANSTLNFVAGQTVANASLVALADVGAPADDLSVALHIAGGATAHYVLDVTGYAQ